MERRRFLVWSFVGALLWVLSITLLGYNLGRRVPWLRDNIDYAILAILALSAVPIAFEWFRRRRHEEPEQDQMHDPAASVATDAADGTGPGADPDATDDTAVEEAQA
jgi:membrane-associated protein